MVKTYWEPLQLYTSTCYAHSGVIGHMVKFLTAYADQKNTVSTCLQSLKKPFEKNEESRLTMVNPPKARIPSSSSSRQLSDLFPALQTSSSRGNFLRHVALPWANFWIFTISIYVVYFRVLFGFLLGYSIVHWDFKSQLYTCSYLMSLYISSSVLSRPILYCKGVLDMFWPI